MSDSLKTLFPLIFDSINNGVFTVDEEFRITSFNSAAERIVGMKRDDAIGQKCHEVFRASICQGGCVLRETLESGEPQRDVRVDILNAKMDGVPILVSTAVLKNRTGQMVGGVEIFRDVSDVESLRNELAGRHQFRDIVGQSDQSRPRGDGKRGEVSRRPVLPHKCDTHRAASARPKAQGYTFVGCTFHKAAHRSDRSDTAANEQESDTRPL